MEWISGREFRPELMPRRGELTAWGLTLAAGVAWLALRAGGRSVLAIIPIFGVFLFVAALLISLTNWVDRHTVLRLDRQGIAFDNGIRRVTLGWDEIQEVRVFPGVWSKQVRVQGKTTHFLFNMLAEVKRRGATQGRVGFAQGEDILNEIVRSANLHSGDPATSGDYYYRP
jgi:hypothetical protein